MTNGLISIRIFLLGAIIWGLIPIYIYAGSRDDIVNLSGNLEYIVDANAEKSLASIRQEPNERWQSAQGKAVNLGFRHEVLWFRLQIPACEVEQQRRVLEIAYPLLDHLEIWQVGQSHLPVGFKLGDKQAFDDRPFKHHNFAVPVHCEPGSWMLLRVQTTSSVQIPIYLWNESDFLVGGSEDEKPQFLYFGAMLVMALYNAFVFVSVRRMSYIIYVLFTLSFASFQAGITGMGFRYLWPHFPLINDFVIDKPLNCVTLFAFVFAVQYLQVRENFPKTYRWCVGLQWILSLYTLSSFFLPYRLGIMFTILIILGTISFSSVVILRSILLRRREGYFYGMAWCTFLLGAFVLALNKLGFLPRNFFTENSVQVASVMEALLLSFALADQLHVLRKNLAQSHKKLQSTLDSIAGIVAEKTQNIRSILETVQQGILTFRGQKLLIEGEFSPYTLSLLETPNLAGTALKESFLDRLDLLEDQKLAVQNALQASLDDGLIAFELNASQMPSEVRLRTAQGMRDLVVDWTPILGNGEVIDRFLLVFRDVTDWKKLERVQSTQSEMLHKLQQMLETDPQLLRVFLLQAEKVLDLSLAQVLKNDPETILKNLFVDIHTLKGESRALGLNDLADSCHRLEDALSRMRRGEVELTSQSLQLQLLQTYGNLQTYLKIYRERMKSILSEHELVVGTTQLVRWKERLSLMLKEPKNEALLLTAMLQDLYAILYVPFEQIQLKLQRWSRRIAHELEREEPDIEVLSEISYFDSKTNEVLDKIFIHLLQNSLSHGIEGAQVRKNQGKPPKGSIHIHFEVNGRFLRLTFMDDGPGFDRARILKRAVALNKADGTVELTDEALVKLVLSAGFSSLESVHNYAGRGVGLDAVDSLSRQLGAELHLDLLPSDQPNFIPFQVRIELPLELFPEAPWQDAHTRVA